MIIVSAINPCNHSNVYPRSVSHAMCFAEPLLVLAIVNTQCLWTGTLQRNGSPLLDTPYVQSMTALITVPAAARA